MHLREAKSDSETTELFANPKNGNKTGEMGCVELNDGKSAVKIFKHM